MKVTLLILQRRGLALLSKFLQPAKTITTTETPMPALNSWLPLRLSFDLRLNGLYIRMQHTAGTSNRQASL